jgi:hypothetical protein
MSVVSRLFAALNRIQREKKMAAPEMHPNPQVVNESDKEKSPWLTPRGVHIRIAAALLAKKRNIAAPPVRARRGLRLSRAIADTRTVKAS